MESSRRNKKFNPGDVATILVALKKTADGYEQKLIRNFDTSRIKVSIIGQSQASGNKRESMRVGTKQAH